MIVQKIIIKFNQAECRKLLRWSKQNRNMKIHPTLRKLPPQLNDEMPQMKKMKKLSRVFGKYLFGFTHHSSEPFATSMVRHLNINLKCFKVIWKVTHGKHLQPHEPMAEFCFEYKFRESGWFLWLVAGDPCWVFLFITIFFYSKMCLLFAGEHPYDKTTDLSAIYLCPSTPLQNFFSTYLNTLLDDVTR